MRRYVCPRCTSGKLAPERLDPEDTRGVCLGCSEETGRLVRRVWVGARRAEEQEQQRWKNRLERRRETRARQKERLREATKAAYVVAGLDTSEVLHQIVMSRAVQDELDSERRGVREARRLTLTVRRSTRKKYHTGRCFSRSWRIVVTFGADVDAAAVRWLLAHEACHLPVSPRNRGGRRESHGPDFRGRLRRVVAELWGVDVPDPGGRCHNLDMAILEALRAKET